MNKLGMYYPADSFWHSADPRSKFLLIFALMIAVMRQSMFGLLAVTLILFLLYVTAKLPVNLGLDIIIKFKWILGITFFANLFFPFRPEVGLGGAMAENWLTAITVVVRLAELLLFAVWLSLVTKPFSLVDGLNKFLKPFSKLKRSLADLTLIMSLTLRFIPELMEDAENIILAQKIRGATPGVNWRGGRTWIKCTLIPIFISSIRKSARMAVAMEARGFRPGAPRGLLEELHMRAADYLIIVGSAGIIAVTVFFR